MASKSVQPDSIRATSHVYSSQTIIGLLLNLSASCRHLCHTWQHDISSFSINPSQPQEPTALSGSTLKLPPFSSSASTSKMTSLQSPLRRLLATLCQAPIIIQFAIARASGSLRHRHLASSAALHLCQSAPASIQIHALTHSPHSCHRAGSFSSPCLSIRTNKGAQQRFERVETPKRSKKSRSKWSGPNHRLSCPNRSTSMSTYTSISLSPLVNLIRALLGPKGHTTDR